MKENPQWHTDRQPQSPLQFDLHTNKHMSEALSELFQVPLPPQYASNIDKTDDNAQAVNTLLEFCFDFLSLVANVQHCFLMDFSSERPKQYVYQLALGNHEDSLAIQAITHSQSNAADCLSMLRQYSAESQGHQWQQIKLPLNNLKHPELYLFIEAEFHFPQWYALIIQIMHARIREISQWSNERHTRYNIYRQLAMTAAENLATDQLCQQLNAYLINYLSDVQLHVMLQHDGHLSMQYSSGKVCATALHKQLAEAIIKHGTNRLFTPLMLNKLDPNTQQNIAWYGTPLTHQGNIIGVFALSSQDNKHKINTIIQELINYTAALCSLVMQQQMLQFSIESEVNLEQQVQEKLERLHQTNQRLEHELKQYQSATEQLSYGSLYDSLTQLPNRALFAEKLDQALKRVKRHPSETFAVVFIDLDQFKTVNQSHGHHIGDQLLIAIARLLSQCIRQNDIVARLGGDEFIVLLDRISQQQDILDITERIIQSFSQPLTVKGLQIQSSCHLGICQVNASFHSVEQILQQADMAMYQAKSQDSEFCFYQEMQYQQQEQIQQHKLSNALAKGLIIPHYQPMIRLRDNALMGFEVVARWQDKTSTLRRALDFIPFAERSGLIIELDRHILQQACIQLKKWQHLNPSNKHIRVAVNLSPKHLLSEPAVNELIKTIKRCRIAPNSLVFEFSEKEFVRQNQTAFDSLEKLRQAGVKVGMDDFGTGFSSLNALFEYPIDFIKVDHSFTQRMLSSKKDLSLMRAVRDISNDLGFQVIIEGIETMQQHEKLVEIGCEYGQGYYISKPMRPGEIQHLFEV
ncbi:putative bifunctional diguanylate cyclase/phosphodiesterase [Motilimonas pumila]|uniref:Phosphodiesterase n=1 Tax=Motilimonas pumila TaxID=2303987 RepID=A0A418YH64_9GAMM|nr:GGDEF domain-containing phosphodiesterase [Motilimonas pumila]RJG49442.1 phosphodiesterase [Motilimonas pumila]